MTTRTIIGYGINGAAAVASIVAAVFSAPGARWSWLWLAGLGALNLAEHALDEWRAGAGMRRLRAFNEQLNVPAESDAELDALAKELPRDAFYDAFNSDD